MESNREKHTYYLSKIPTITKLHPKIEEAYKKKVGTWPKQKFLESSYIPDSHKISAIKYFDPESGESLARGVKYAKNIDEAKDKSLVYADKYMSPYLNTSYNGRVYYENLQDVGHFGGKKRKSRKNKRKSKNKKRTRKHKY